MALGMDATGSDQNAVCAMVMDEIYVTVCSEKLTLGLNCKHAGHDIICRLFVIKTTSSRQQRLHCVVAFWLATNRAFGHSDFSLSKQ